MSWEMVKLKDCCFISMGQAPAGSSYNESGDGIALIAGAGDFGETTPVPKKYTTEAKRITDIGDIILCIRATIGDINWANDKYCLGRGVAGLRAISRKLDQNYLWFFIFTNKQSLYSQATGSTFKQVSRPHIENWEIPLPPLPEQKRIAAILDKADAIRRKRQQAIDLADQYLRSVFLDMFGDPVTNPKGWEEYKFSDIGTIDRGVSKHRPRNAPELLDGKFPLIQTGDVANSGGYITTYKNTYSDFGLKQSKLWPEGTLCITIAANIAKTGILTFDACFPDSVVGFIPNTKSNTEYVRYWLSFLQSTLEARAPESAQKNINLNILRNLMLPIPPVELQNKFANIVLSCKGIKDSFTKSSLHMNHQFNSLSQQAFAGKL